MAEKGLGTGLGALLGGAALESEAADYVYLPISQVEPAANQPRKQFDEISIAGLAESIEKHGIIQPLTVRRMSSGYYQIIAGERRWRAARMLGLGEVPVRIMQAGDREATELALVENLQREDLNPIEEAEGFRILTDEYRLTQEEVASRVGRSRSTVTNALRLLSMPEEIKKMVETGSLSAGHARAIIQIKGEFAQLEAARRVAESELSVRQTEKMVKSLQTEPAPKPKNPEVDYIAEVETKLTRALGRKVRIAHGKKRGCIELEYYGIDDFERMIEALELLGSKGGGELER